MIVGVCIVRLRVSVSQCTRVLHNEPKSQADGAESLSCETVSGILTDCSLLRFHLMTNEFPSSFSFFKELMLLVHRVGSLLPKCVLSFLNKSKEHMKFPMLHGQFIVKW